jgi:hypothetical protein
MGFSGADRVTRKLLARVLSVHGDWQLTRLTTLSRPQTRVALPTLGAAGPYVTLQLFVP